MECFALCDEVDRLRGLLARALPWIDPNDSHEDYLLTVEIRKALGRGRERRRRPACPVRRRHPGPWVKYLPEQAVDRPPVPWTWTRPTGAATTSPA